MRYICKRKCYQIFIRAIKLTLNYKQIYFETI